MTHDEVAAKLQHFNDWGRGHHDEQPDPRELGEAIDAAVEMIDRLEAAESEVLEQAFLNGMGSEREAALMAKLEAAEKERAALRAKIAEMERQEPAGTLHDDGCFVWRETAPHQSNYAGWKMALYALPGAKGE